MRKILAAAGFIFCVSLLCPHIASAVDAAELETAFSRAFHSGNDAELCKILGKISDALSRNPKNERLLKMRIYAYGLLGDPYSAKADIDALAALHPNSPAHQLAKCMYAEATGAGTDENRTCYLAVAGLCEKTSRINERTGEYFLALTLAESPKAQEAKKYFLESLSDSPADQHLREVLSEFTREMMVRKVDPEEVHNPCVKRQ